MEHELELFYSGVKFADQWVLSFTVPNGKLLPFFSLRRSFSLFKICMDEETKCAPFCGYQCEIQFREWKSSFFIPTPAPVGIKSALVSAMAWHFAYGKPLTEAMMTKCIMLLFIFFSLLRQYSSAIVQDRFRTHSGVARHFPIPWVQYILTQWGRVTHICDSKLTSLVQIMACRLVDAKTLSEPMMEHC